MDNETRKRTTVAIAGASGFIGRALIEALSPDYDIVAFTRDASGRSPSPGVEWRGCDLFNLRDAEHALAGCDSAFYLVHSMMPSSRLSQGTFEDMDLVCADNFARAAAKEGVSHIVYLGGLLPESPDEPLSKHLESRSEVERALSSHGARVTTLRAGLVIGAGGSSFEMMSRLVKRLPVMLGPRWTRSRSQSIALVDVVALLRYALQHPELAGLASLAGIPGLPSLPGRAYDVGCPDVVSYAEMLVMTGEVLGKRTRIVTIPINTPKLSLLWISLVAGAPQELVRPLVESLKHDMVASDGLVLQKQAGLAALPLREALERAVRDDRAVRDERAAKGARARARREGKASAEARGDVPEVSRARSVQRLRVPPGRDAVWVAAEYLRWLPRFMRPFLRVDVDAARVCKFYFRPLTRPLLVLEFSEERSSRDRQLFYVTGGLLARDAPAGAGGLPRLEFRTVLDGTQALAAVHDFAPSLPWIVYAFTQALVHLFVMKRFARHLERAGTEPHLPAPVAA